MTWVGITLGGEIINLLFVLSGLCLNIFKTEKILRLLYKKKKKKWHTFTNLKLFTPLCLTLKDEIVRFLKESWEKTDNVFRVTSEQSVARGHVVQRKIKLAERKTGHASLRDIELPRRSFVWRIQLSGTTARSLALIPKFVFQSKGILRGIRAEVIAAARGPRFTIIPTAISKQARRKIDRNKLFSNKVEPYFTIDQSSRRKVVWNLKKKERIWAWRQCEDVVRYWLFGEQFHSKPYYHYINILNNLILNHRYLSNHLREFLSWLCRPSLKQM